ncbi:recombinase family protein [Alicyclobacillus dauci]|uniref:Recombinase family protein n=1 Tax=Alicyclobacillus dauci TaxID=1475485 RepID=A0ABY6Z7T5_9BACL|nr:recombinase family protein [Alicyclobacillus dauci]WAH38231.1 recombinase family protein [Alicyclobacillus dauci]
MVRQGRYFGHTPPYGYDLKDGRLYINPIEAKVIRTMFDRYFAGDGVSRLVKFLNDPSNNMPRPRGSDEWSQKVVNACIKNPVYCGYVRYGNTGNKKYKNQETVMAKSDHEPIIDEFQWRRAQMLMEQRRIIGGRSGTGSYPLVGVLRCGNCGGPMIGHTVPAGKNGRINPYFGYLCNARRHKRVCTMKMWKRDVIEPAVISEIERIAHEMIQRAKMEPEPKDTQSERINIEAALFQLKQRRKKWMDAFDKEFISGEDLRDRLNEINQEEEQLRSLKQEETNAPQPISLDDLRDVRKTWDAANDQERKELIRSMVETAWVNEDGSVRVDLRMVF